MLAVMYGHLEALRLEEEHRLQLGTRQPPTTPAQPLPLTGFIGRLFTAASHRDIDEAIFELMHTPHLDQCDYRWPFAAGPVMLATSEIAMPFASAWLESALTELSVRYGKEMRWHNGPAGLWRLLLRNAERAVNWREGAPSLNSLVSWTCKGAVVDALSEVLKQETAETNLAALDDDTRTALHTRLAGWGWDTRSATKQLASAIERLPWTALFFPALSLNPAFVDYSQPLGQLTTAINWRIFSHELDHCFYHMMVSDSMPDDGVIAL